MAKIDKQIITMRKIEDNAVLRRYSAVSGECKGVATVDKNTLNYSYTGDDLEEFASFLKDTLTKSIKLGKKLPDKFSHGFG
ncbi:hypothetical protein [Streptococcus oralis]|jgi:hypothetical protein|uniref:hypothetical protein n=1 Tax=Streptococcus oralis TaxID=1303 RepID=UPI00066DE249|nr:hypothetical protein [Streptococcus oralis]DAW49752.1 MAG TPA: hypothetical protein [Caudoviricetes sp.]